ncbi:PREDICTED: small integral membrane protein 4 [Dinoponera quadriceps]|uniref:Small integral membrane protein 4 n=1 Tax=Dinoponera quadriceps TaxID=609295 RepID=A0A6P3XT89_DINQU|nr:PREDICTED: small integral membrane protein 4 [Dinoponera quadriceps]
MFFSPRLRRFIKKWPGERYFGDFRFLPIFFALGALLEFSMINWHVGQVNFYNVYKRRKIEERVKEKLPEAD